MVLRSGIIIPFQFRDNKKLLMIGVPEENRDLSIWDLKNVVRAAFGIYNFEFRNKKIGFNIPDELLLNYLAQRHDLTNFVIEVGQVYEPTDETHCTSCRCLPAPQKCTGEDLSRGPVNLQSHQRRYRHSSSSSSRHSISPPPPPIVATAASKKRRHTLNTNEIHTQPEDTSEGSCQLPMETKIEYDYMNNEDEAPSIANPSVVNVAAYQGEAPNPEINFERLQMQHEFYLKHQQQQQHHQQQLQQHMEALLHDRPNNNLRQRKERMSRKQKEVYVTYLEQTPIMSEYKRNDPFLDAHWQKLTGILNSVPQGAIKSMNEWKQAFDNWRFRIYLYARFNSKITGDAVLNPKNFKPLTITDKRAYSLWIRNPDTAPPDLDKMRNIFVNLDETPQE